jgi:hypothetical protein
MSNKAHNPASCQAAVSGSGFRGKVHKKVHSSTITNYYFTKDKNNCLMIEYDSREDYGENSTSGTWISRIIFHQNNAFTKKELSEIKLSEVPESIIRILQYLC